jgi:hypothetical protein
LLDAWTIRLDIRNAGINHQKLADAGLLVLSQVYVGPKASLRQCAEIHGDAPVQSGESECTNGRFKLMRNCVANII